MAANKPTILAHVPERFTHVELAALALCHVTTKDLAASLVQCGAFSEATASAAADVTLRTLRTLAEQRAEPFAQDNSKIG